MEAAEPHPPDLPGSFFGGQPLPHAQGFQLVPALHIGEHVHQVKVHMVGTQTAQFLGEIAFQIPGPADQILGQFGGDVDLVPAMVAGQDLPQGGFTARVDVRRIEVIHPIVDSGQNLLFGLVQVDACTLAGKAHAAVSQNRERLALFIVAVLHDPLHARYARAVSLL